MSTYQVMYFPANGPAGSINISADYWEYDAEFVAFYLEDAPKPPTGPPREIVCAVPLDLSPIVLRTAA